MSVRLAGLKVDWKTRNNVEWLCNEVTWGSFGVSFATFSMAESTIAYPEGNELNDFVPFGLGQLGSSRQLLARVV
jgi:hypothetical protein